MSVPHHVLILTPDQARSEKQRRVLEKEGYRVMQANILLDALSRIQEQEPDVVVTDLWIEDSPMALVMKTILKVAPHAQFIALQSDATQTGYAVDAVLAGAFCTLPAACENHLFLATVLRAVERRTMKTDLTEVQERLALLFRSVDTGVLLVDARSRQIVDVNPAAAALCRRPKEALVGLVSDDPGAHLPPLRTLTQLQLGGNAYWLQGIDDDLGSSRYEALLATLGVLQVAAFEGMSDACFTVTSGGAIDTVIHGGALAGVRMQAGRSAVDLFRGDAGPEFEHAVKCVFETGEPQYLSQLGPDGSGMSVRVLPVKNRDVIISVLVYGHYLDADAREARRLRLRDAALDHVRVGLLVVSKEGRVLDVNQHLADRLGCPRRELLEKSYWGIDRACSAEQWAEMWARLDADLKGIGDRAYLDFRERAVHVRVSMCRLEEGCDAFALVVSQDATQLQSVEAVVKDLRAHEQVVLDLIQDAVISLDRRGVISEANKAACGSLHREPARVIGKCYYDLLPESLVQSRKAHIEGAFIGGKRVAFQDDDGEHSFESHILPVRNHAGVLAEVILLSRRIWQPTDATLLETHLNADYSLEADQHARMCASLLLQERMLPTLEGLVESSTLLATRAGGAEPLEAGHVEALSHAIKDVRETLNASVNELCSGDPPAHSLMASLSLIANETRSRWGVECACNVSATMLELAPNQIFHLCAMTRDAIAFSVRRRSAKGIKISVKKNRQEISLRISDDAKTEHSFATSGVIMALIERRAHEIGARVALSTDAGGGESLTCTLSVPG